MTPDMADKATFDAAVRDVLATTDEDSEEQNAALFKLTQQRSAAIGVRAPSGPHVSADGKLMVPAVAHDEFDDGLVVDSHGYVELTPKHPQYADWVSYIERVRPELTDKLPKGD